MAEFIVDALGPGLGTERLRGAVVAVVDDGAPRGTKEVLPNFVWIKVPSMTRTALSDRATPITFTMGATVVSDDPVGDAADVRFHNKNQCSIPAPNNWVRTLNNLLVDTSMSSIVQEAEGCACHEDGEAFALSRWVWGTDKLTTYQASDYDSGTGVRELYLDYTPVLTDHLLTQVTRVRDREEKRAGTRPSVAEAQDVVTANLESSFSHPRHGEFVSADHVLRRAVVRYKRADLRFELVRDMTDFIDFVYVKRRYIWAESVVAAAEANGGELEVADLTDLIDRTTL